MRKITVVGAGKGGHAIAGYTALLGNEVTLLTHTKRKADIMKERNNQILLQGIINGEAQLKETTMNVESAVRDSELIFIVTDATAHQAYAKKMAPYLQNQKVILISPGVGGALEFYKIIKEFNPEADVTVSETDTLIYACNVPQIGESHIKAQKNSIIFTTMPENKSIESEIQRLYPQFKDVNEPLMGVDDSPVFHICGMIFNADRINKKEDFNFYIDGITPDVARYMEEMDEERCEIAKALGISYRPIKQWLNIVYGVPVSDLYMMIQHTPPYQNTLEMPNRSPAPKSLIHRYLIEEILLRAVPTSSIGKALEIETPKYDEMIQRATDLTGINFREQGRKIEDMGLNQEQIINWKYRTRNI
ncbi:MAG: NAD/NADP octopine/nopaline dehydrogenase family protein [Nanoarchaeota archaeon]|nr:NAD/NADP octopine/nopaline dehydrogenase family protein [Nanoarchaeota archaeon]MBU1321494.1 NAD/NADP octopine/nopaline dehydrogenase family protein [Nanoarchaeota archaeon]MBU1597378.1 NAD/NADP octopine/nopaline dehydrogenase family protein [Nanoarchaeota archaeon]MBU2441209.1 NAD/NADP octopine/nopaline dehydrogenase family protein [Nanoarchaeota archaeon]